MSKKQTNIYDDLLHQADPHAVAADPTHVQAMISSGSRNSMAGTADHLPMAHRPGALDADKLPSRMSNKLHYRDGRVESI